MYFVALATDYDGTLASDGVVSAATLASLQRLKETGRKLILVTGRELPDLRRVFPDIGIFDKVVAENGALLYTPATETEKAIAPEPPADFVASLEAKGVAPLSVGRSIVATWEPHQATALDTIKEFGLELDIIFNKGAVMILPSGVNKATGLDAALSEIALSPHNVVGVGDAENDHAFLRACGCSVAVANALPAVKDTADLVMKGSRGEGVEELIEALMEQDQDLGFAPRNRILIGRDADGQPAELRPMDCVLIAGSSGIGKSTLATALTERCVEKGFQFCVFDPEGDYGELENAVTVGDGNTPPNRKQALELLENPQTNIVLSALAVEQEKRPEFFAEFLPDMAGLRAKTARPHWLIADEAHHLIPKSRDSASLALSKELPGTILITVHPGAVAADALRLITAVLALGPKADEVVETFCRQIKMPLPEGLRAPEGEHILFWRPGEPPRLVEAEKPRQSRKRHSRKYAQGELDEGASFYFRGPDGALNLRAQNLIIFLQIAEGVDDPTWEHHLRAGDYSEWFRRQIKDDALADEAAAVEADKTISPAESRKRIAECVRRRYTGPASAD
jgi:HAD superfamily hydrolase (TIGR01484 family)